MLYQYIRAFRAYLNIWKRRVSPPKKKIYVIKFIPLWIFHLCVKVSEQTRTKGNTTAIYFIMVIYTLIKTQRITV